MYAVAKKSGKKTWQTRRHLVSVEAALAIQRENVMNRLLQLRAEIGHPEKPDKPLPQDQAAARAGVTVRQWQRWESGESVPYARNLSEVADAFGFDVGEFYDGPAGKEPAETPSPFGSETQLDRVERRLDALDGALAAASQEREQHAAEIQGYLKRQDAILRSIEESVSAEKAAKAEAEESRRQLLEAVDVVRRIYADAALREEAEHGTRAT